MIRVTLLEPPYPHRHGRFAMHPKLPRKPRCCKGQRDPHESMVVAHQQISSVYESSFTFAIIYIYCILSKYTSGYCYLQYIYRFLSKSTNGYCTMLDYTDFLKADILSVKHGKNGNVMNRGCLRLEERLCLLRQLASQSCCKNKPSQREAMLRQYSGSSV